MYHYAGNNPVRYVDPTGEFVISLTGVFLIASVGVLVTYFTALNAMQGDDNAHLPVDIRSGTGLLSAGKKGNGSAQADNTKLRLESSAQAVAPNPMPPDDKKKKKPSSQNQLQKQVERGQAPKDVDRVDKPHQKGQQSHVHFKDKTSLNQDGTVHDAHNGIPSPSNEVKNWLRNNGWNTGE